MASIFRGQLVVHYLQAFPGKWIRWLSKQDQQDFEEAVEQLGNSNTKARERGLVTLRRLAAQGQPGNQLALELVHWLAGDFLYGDPYEIAAAVGKR